ncbi:MAG: hypothetical protein GY697_22025 [Desulfobacterales bacterium]|nr:hypothetical protein [Desulfobacterales bacterium]
MKSIPWLKDYFQKIPGKMFPWSLIGADLKAISLEFGIKMQEIADQKYGTVKLYHQDAVAVYKGRVKAGNVREAVAKYLK